jgi:hypothetical protein
MINRLTKVIALALSASFLLLPAAFGANTPNGPCNKAGKTSTIAGAKFICTKSGKKLIWKKISIKPAATNQSNDDAKLEAIFNGIAKKMDNVIPKFDISLNVDPVLVDSKWSRDSTSSIDSAIKLLSALGIESTTQLKIYVSWGSEFKDRFVPDQCKVSSGGGYCGQGIHFADLEWFATNWGYDGIEKPYKNEMDKLAMAANIPHEIGHFAQGEAALSVGNSDFWMYNPPWLREGGAEYFKLISSAYHNKTTYKSLRDLVVASGVSRCDKFPLSKITPADSKSDGCEYGKGLLAVEYLVLKVGSADALFTMNKTLGRDTESIFEKAYGFSLKDFEKEVDLYFARVVNSKK